MPLLIDTHAVIWWLFGDARLGKAALKAMSDEADRYVSAASVWEISTKVRLGKLPGCEEIEPELPGILDQADFIPLAIETRHAHLAGRLPGPHKDPFDRMLIAQARIEDLSIVSIDTAFDDYGVPRLWEG